MKLITTILMALSVLVFCSMPATAQVPDCWHYENGDAVVIDCVNTLGYSYSVAVSGSYAFVADAWTGLQVVDFANPEDLQIVGYVDTPHYVRGLDISGSYVYAADGLSGLQVIEISDAENPQIVGSVDTPCEAFDVAVSGNYALVADALTGLQVIDIADPENPVIVGSIVTPMESKAVDVQGSYAYATAILSGLHVIDISNPINPQITGSVSTQNRAGDVAIADGYAYVTGGPMPMNPGDSYLHVIDITDPENPEVVGEIVTQGQAWGVAVSGSCAYVGSSYGLEVVSIVDPTNPQSVGYMSTPEGGWGVAVAEPYIFTGSGYAGLVIAWQQCAEAIVVDIDVKPGSETNPINYRSSNGVVPVAILTTDLFDATTVDHTTVRFGPDEAAETHENPHGPVRHEEDVDRDGNMDLMFHFRFNETGIQCGDSEVTLTGQTYDGMAFNGTDQIITVPNGRGDERPARFLQVNPNPSNPKTTLSFYLERPQRATVSVFDMIGRRVAVVADQAYGAGPHTVEWNGKDASGRAVSSGTYLVRLETEDRMEARKVMLIK